jgi:hypothetical protein
MAAKGIKETEKVAVGAIRTALQTWLAPQLSDLGARMTHVEARLDGIDRRLEAIDQRFAGIDHRLDGIDKRLDGVDQRLHEMDQRMDQRLHEMDQRNHDFQKFLEENLRSMRNEIEARFDAVRSDIKRLENITELREPLASVETKLAERSQA